MASTSVTRDQNEAEVLRLHASGMPQRAIATRLGVSRPMVQRIINSSDGILPAGSDDDDGVYAEFSELAKAAQSENTLEAYRNVHKVALTCHQNGYDVPWHSLPYLMLLSHTAVDANVSSRRKLRAEIRQVYQDRKDWRDSNA